MTTFVTKRYVHLNRSGSDQSTLDAAEAYITGTFRVGGDITLGDESTDLIHATGSVRISGSFDVGEVGVLPLEVGFFVSGSPGSRGTGINPTVALFGGDVHISGNLTVEGAAPGLRHADFLTGFGEGATAGVRAAWQLSSDPLASKTAWSVGVILTRNTTATGEGEQRIWSTSGQHLTGGATFALDADGAQPKLYFTNTGNSFQTVTSEYRTDYRAGTLFSVVTYTGGNTLMYSNGAYADGAGGSTTGQAYVSSSFPFTVGASAQPLNDYGAEDWGIHAVCYVTRSLSSVEVLDWWRHIYVSGTLVDIPNAPGNGLNGAWRVSSANPSGGTWSPFIGAASLIKTGSKAHSVKSIPLRW